MPAAHALHTLGENHLVAGFRHELNDLIDKVVNLAATLRLAHGLVDARGEIYDLEVRCLMADVRGMRYGLFNDELSQIRWLRLTFFLRHGGGPKRQTHLVHTTADAGHEGGTEGEVSGVGNVEDNTQTALDASHVISCKLTNLISYRTLVHIHLTNQVRQFAGVDLHRAGRRAQTVGGTGLVTVVLILLFQRG